MKHFKLFVALAGILLGHVLPGLLVYPFKQIFFRFRHPEAYHFWRRFYKLQSLIDGAYKSGDYDQAKSLAFEYLDLARRAKHDWNYGNAIHGGHQMLGLIRLREGDLAEAKNHLRAAGQTPGSPQLNSFGPRMILARELLLQGEKQVVVQYLDSVAKFWASEKNVPPSLIEDENKAQVRQKKALIHQWKEEIQEGQVPQHNQWK